MLHGTDDEGETIILIRHLILGQRQASPTVYTAQSHLHLVDTKIGKIGLLNLL